MTSDPYLRIKAAVRDATKAAGGAHRAADISRVDAARMSRYGAPHEATHIPADVIADIEQDLGAPIITRVLADLAGYVLVPKKSAAVTTETILHHLADVHETTSALETELIRDAADGQIDDQEAVRIEAACDAAELQIAELRADARRARKPAAQLKAVK